MSIHYNNDNTIIFTLARMNPPTPGHLLLIKQLINCAISKNVQKVYVILSKTNNNSNDPIPCLEKINVLGNADDVTKTMIRSLKQIMIHETMDPVLQSKIENINVITICVPEVKGATPFTPVTPIILGMSHIPDVNLFLIIGNDRKEMLDSITSFFFKFPNVNSVDGLILPREEMSVFKEISKDPVKLHNLDISTVPINAISASFVRNIVANGRQDKFLELYAPYLNEDKIEGLYGAILYGLTFPPEVKKDAKEKPLKYAYPMIKGISEFPIVKTGGTRRKRKRANKRRRTYKKRNNSRAH
jgi:nicotinic acid mononucleotide adenylyltransferase